MPRYSQPDPIIDEKPFEEQRIDIRRNFEKLFEAVNELGSNSTLFYEQSDPAAPATDHCVLYARDNGAGKTQLCVRFATGAVQILATEP